MIHTGLRGLGLAPCETVFVGDNFAEDACGAEAAGLDVAWIDARGEGVPATGPTPRYVIRGLDELHPVLTGTI